VSEPYVSYIISHTLSAPCSKPLCSLVVVTTGSLACEAECRHPSAAWCNLTPGCYCHCHCSVVRIKRGCLLFLVQHSHRLRGNGQKVKKHCILKCWAECKWWQNNQTHLDA